MIRIIAVCVLALVACKDERAKSKPVPAVAPLPVDEAPVPPEADLGRTCKSDSDCSAAAPHCFAFDTEGHVHPRGELACTRTCLDKRCPAGFQCSTLGFEATNAVTGERETHRAAWCGRKSSAVLVENIETGKLLRWSSQDLDGAPIYAVLRDGTIRVVLRDRYSDDKDRNYDLVFANADVHEAVAAFRYLVARGGYIGPVERKKLSKKVPSWPEATPSGETTAHEQMAIGHFLAPGLAKKLVSAGVLGKVMWPADAKLEIVETGGEREIPLIDLAAFDAELAKQNPK